MLPDERPVKLTADAVDRFKSGPGGFNMTLDEGWLCFDRLFLMAMYMAARLAQNFPVMRAKFPANP